MRSVALRRDDGMSVFEVVFAAAIMFVVLTGVLGLVATSTSMGIDSKQRNLLTNTIASRMEYARGLPFEQVDIAVSGGSGVLPVKETFTVNGITVNVYYAVRNGASGTKELRLSTTASVPGRPLVTASAFSIIRDTTQDVRQFTGVALGPNLRWSATTPADDSVIFDNLVWNTSGVNDLLILGAQAEPQNSMYTIKRMEMFVVGSGTDVIFLKDGTSLSAGTAQWEWTPGTSSASVSFHWHTKQVLVGSSGSPVPAISDGWQTVRCRAWDNQDHVRSVDRAFYVDNYPPGDSGVPTVTVFTDVLASGSWSPGDDATMYDVTQYRQRPTGLGPYTDAMSWDSSPTATVSGLMTDLETNAFSRYIVTSHARSPRLDSANAVPSAPYVSRPLAGGEMRIAGSLKMITAVATLTVTPPTFPCEGWTTYDYSYRLGASGAWNPLGSRTEYGSAPATYVSPGVPMVKSGSQWEPVYYRCRVTFTPSGVTGGTSDSVWSDTVSVSPWPWGSLASIGATGTLTHSEW